jgi:hypothetical protein
MLESETIIIKKEQITATPLADDPPFYAWYSKKGWKKAAYFSAYCCLVTVQEYIF